MITYSKKGKRHYNGYSDHDLGIKGQVFWILFHNPPTAGFNRREWTREQKDYIEREYNLINYPPDYAEMLHNITGQ